MVTPEHETRMVIYLAAYNKQFSLKSTRIHCDRCRPNMPQRYVEDIEKWTQAGPGGAEPYLCIDCARHYGLVW